MLDDLQPVRELTKGVSASPVHLFPVQDATRWRRGSESWASEFASFPNPPAGASIYYYLKDKAKGELKIEILDATNRLVKTLSSVPRASDGSDDEDDTEALKKAALPVTAGVQRAVWDLTWEGSKKIRGAKIDYGDPDEGPQAVPGKYIVRLTVDGTTLTSPLTLSPDPRGGISQADLEAQLAFSLRVRDTITKLTELVHSMRSVKSQLTAREEALAGRKSEAPIAELLKAGHAVIEKVDSLEARLHNPKAEVTYDILAERGGARLYSRLSPLLMWTTFGDAAPTQGMQDVLRDYEQELGPLERDVQAILSNEVAGINGRAKSLGVEFVIR
jgi:hypothetical protein